MPKREARIARDIERKLKEQEKSARLRERVPARGIRVDEAVTADRSIRLGADPGSIFSMQMTWTQEGADVADAWSWGTRRQWSQEDWDSIIAPKLREWERLTWSEIDRLNSGAGHKMHHSMDTPAICDEAQYRMVEIDRYADDIFRFRLGNARRLWGHRIINRFEILWYDPTHQIYPTEPG